MPFDINVKTTQEFDIRTNYDTVFDTLADVPYSAAEFPKLQQLVDLGDERYRWEMEPINLAGYTAQTVYACAYTWDKAEGWIAWEPTEAENTTARIQGRWDMQPNGDNATHLKFHSEGAITLPFPALARVVVAPVAAAEFAQLVKGYVRNLSAFWNS